MRLFFVVIVQSSVEFDCCRFDRFANVFVEVCALILWARLYVFPFYSVESTHTFNSLRLGFFFVGRLTPPIGESLNDVLPEIFVGNFTRAAKLYRSHEKV